jgi:hypothetical protein
MRQMAVPPDNIGHNLPAIVSVEASRVRYDPPRRHYVGKELMEIREGIELLVRTAAPLPVRAITPVLFIGDTVVSDYEVAGPNLYRFFLFDLERITLGAPIALGWPFAPRAIRPTSFRFEIPRNSPLA